MVLVAAAAAVVAGYGAFKGGKAAAAGAKTKLEEVKYDRARNQEYKERRAAEKQAQEAKQAYEATLTVDDRLARFKRERAIEKMGTKRVGLLGRSRKSGK